MLLRVNSSLLALVLLLLPLLLVSQTLAPPAQAQEAADDQQTAAEGAFKIPEEEQPFWDAAQKFLDAYAQRDAKSIGEMFTDDAEMFDEFGEVTQGREAIVAMYQQVFTESPDALITEINLHKVRYVSDDVAIEEGRAVSKPSADATPNISRYVAIHVREDGVWRIDMLKNFAQAGLSRDQQLQRVAWLVGEWVSEDDESVVQTECDWSEDGNYLLRRFTIRIEGSDVMQGVQRIGWDPVQNQIRSWTFDSEGGFVEGAWTQNGDRWIVVSSGVNSEGQTASGTAVYTIIDAEMVTWQFRNLVIGSELREDLEPIVMTRRPPAPATASN